MAAGNTALAEDLAGTVSSLHATTSMRIDRVTAHMLAHSDEHANEKNEVQLGMIHGSFQWAIWVNTSKNPR